MKRGKLMADILWNAQSKSHKVEYVQFLKIFGALSGLFKDLNEGVNSKKPYLYYRNHEQLYVKVFDVSDLTRKDGAFDALAAFNDQRVGIGLKTWIHMSDKSYQKIAEFNKLAPDQINPLLAKGDYEAAIKKIAYLRNKRLELDKRLYNTTQEIYHFITRDDGIMNIVESYYNKIDLDNIKYLKCNGKTLSFTDGVSNYKYYSSKSVLMAEFDASDHEIISKIPIDQFENPFDLIKQISLNDLSSEQKQFEYKQNTIYLPMYSDLNFSIQPTSALNAQLGKPKVKGSNKRRPAYEAYIHIPSWIHRVFPNFFGTDPFADNPVNTTDPFNLYLPNGNVVTARNTQDNAKGLQTNPQNILGKWILRDVFGLNPYEKLTDEMLIEFGVDSFKIVKIDEKNYSIDLAPTFAFEKWKLNLEDRVLCLKSKSTSQWRLPKFRHNLFEEEEI